MGFKGKSISVASYGAGNKLTNWKRAGSDENHSQTWNYDDAGNWNSTTKDGDTKSRDHSVSDQITQLGGNPVSHDLKGNLTKYKYGRKNYKVKYDLDNRIFSVKSNRRKVTYRYDALGRRIISKKNGNRTALIWWGDSECAEYKHKNRQRVVQHDIMGHPIRLNSVMARDTARGKRKVKLQWYHKNYLDHVYAVSDDNGNLIEHYRYTAFGEPEIYSPTGAKRNTSAIGNTVMWNTRRYDADNGLYYYKYRHYAANIGRWLGRDPIEEYGGYNLYGFTGNDGINGIDVLGLDAEYEVWNSINPFSPSTVDKINGDVPKPKNPSLNELACKEGRCHRDDTNKNKKEYCGYVCKNMITGKRITTSTQGKEGSCKPSDADCPFCHKKIAVWHTHPPADIDGDGVDEYAPEDFSQADKDFADANEIPIFVNTPGGKDLKYDPSTGKTHDYTNEFK